MPAWPQAPDLRSVRAGLDWCNLLFDRAVPRERWRELVERDSLRLETSAGVLELLRSGKARGDVDSIAWSGDGLLVRAVHPERYEREPEHHAARVDVQGLWCSTSQDGLTAVEEARRAVAHALWNDDADAVPCVAGRMDFFSDVEVCASRAEGSEWVEREVFRRGNADAAWRHFASRARETSRKASTVIDLRGLREGRDLAPGERAELQRQLQLTELGQFVGGYRVGRSRVLGRDPRLLTYEADRDPSRDKALVKERWASAGWDGERRVVRTEVRVSRDWFTDNEVLMEDGTRVRLAGEGGVQWPELRALLPSLARTLLLRTRETDVRDRRAIVSKRRNSPLWAANLRGLASWGERLRSGERSPWEGAEAVVSRRRIESVRKETRRAESALVGAWLHAVQIQPDISVAEVALMIGSAVFDGESQVAVERLDDKVRRIATACGYPVPSRSASWRAGARSAPSSAAVEAARTSIDEVMARVASLDAAKAARTEDSDG